jgi:hypothetical protein
LSVAGAARYFKFLFPYLTERLGEVREWSAQLLRELDDLSEDGAVFFGCLV